jgi:hypothetical protein
MNNIPNDEDFARADRVMEERFKNLEVVRQSVIHRFGRLCALHDFWLLPHGTNSFAAVVFFEHDKDINACTGNGICESIVEFTYAELERVGRGNRSSISVGFEFDSHESVLAKFNGDYFLRMR